MHDPCILLHFYYNFGTKVEIIFYTYIVPYSPDLKVRTVQPLLKVRTVHTSHLSKNVHARRPSVQILSVLLLVVSRNSQCV